MFAISIHNEVNQSDKPIGCSFETEESVIIRCNVELVDKLSQSNSRFDALDTLIVMVNSVKMPLGFGVIPIKRRGRPLATMV
jgi:hypothetical protein